MLRESLLFNKMKFATQPRKVLAYTVSDVVAAKMLFAMGVDAVFSDDPQLTGQL